MNWAEIYLGIRQRARVVFANFLKFGKHQFKMKNGVIKLSTAIIFGIWLLFLILAIYFLNINYLNRLGNSYGIISALFSGLAVLGVIYTLLQQNVFNVQQNSFNAQQIGFNVMQNEVNSKNAKQFIESNKILHNTQIASEKQAKNMKIVALLNAYSTLINYYENRIGELEKAHSISSLVQDYQKKIDEIIRKIEDIAKRKDFFDDRV